LNIESVMSWQEIAGFSLACLAVIGLSILITLRAYRRREWAAGLLSLLMGLSVLLMSGLSFAMLYPGPFFFSGIRTGVGGAGSLMLLLGAFSSAEIFRHESIGGHWRVHALMGFALVLMAMPMPYYSIEGIGS
jgi:hypothetical protein